MKSYLLQLMSKSFLMVTSLAILASCATFAQHALAQTQTRQPTPDPYFHPAAIPVAERYRDAEPYSPPNFSPQSTIRSAAGSPLTQVESTLPNLTWAPPNTAVSVSPKPMPNSMGIQICDLKNGCAIPSAAPDSVGGWAPPATPACSLPPRESFNQPITAQPTPLHVGTPNSIIREKSPDITTGQMQVIHNPFTTNGKPAPVLPAANPLTNPNGFQLPAAKVDEPRSIKPLVAQSNQAVEVQPPAAKIPSPQSQNDFSPASSKTFEPAKNSTISSVATQTAESAVKTASLVKDLASPNRTFSPTKELKTDIYGTSPSNQLPQSNGPNEVPIESFELGRVLALVGGEPIFVGDMMFQINQTIEERMPGAPEDVRKQIRPMLIKRFLPQFVNEKMLYVATLESLPDGVEVESVIEQAAGQFDEKELPLMIKSSGVKNVAEFEANLRAQGSSVQQLRTAWAKDQISKWFLSKKLDIANSVSHLEMLDSYHKNIDQYAKKAKSKWEQIMIRFDRTSSREEAEKMAKEILDQVVYGGNFAAVAKKVSHGFRAEQGGQHDWTNEGSLVLKEVDGAIFSLPVGKVSDLIESRDGLHIIRVIDRTDAGHVPFLEAQVKIKEQILMAKRNKAIEKHIAELKARIPVEYYTAN